VTTNFFLQLPIEKEDSNHVLVFASGISLLLEIFKTRINALKWRLDASAAEVATEAALLYSPLQRSRPKPLYSTAWVGHEEPIHLERQTSSTQPKGKDTYTTDVSHDATG
jgi:hypothetical protein